MKIWQTALLCLISVGLLVLFLLTFPSIGSVMVGLIFLMILATLFWQKFLNR